MASNGNYRWSFLLSVWNFLIFFRNYTSSFWKSFLSKKSNGFMRPFTLISAFLPDWQREKYQIFYMNERRKQCLVMYDSMQHFLLVNNPFTKGNWGPMEMWLILELGQEIYKISLENLTALKIEGKWRLDETGGRHKTYRALRICCFLKYFSSK